MIAVIGDVVLDEYIQGEATRISPEAPVPIVEEISTTWNLGGAANVAHNLLSLGHTPLLLGVIGSGQRAKVFLDEMLEAGMSTEGIHTDEFRRTTFKCRIVAQHQQICRVDSEQKNPLSADTEEILVSWLEASAGQLDGVIIADHGKGVITETLIRKVLEIASKSSAWTIVDPCIDSHLRLEHLVGADIITPNEKEARFMALYREHRGSVVEIGRHLRRYFGQATSILITRGANGMSLFTGQDTSAKEVHIKARAVDVFDVSGAGDTVVAVLADGLYHGLDLELAAIEANKAAGYVVGKFGTATVAKGEWEE